MPARRMEGWACRRQSTERDDPSVPWSSMHNPSSQGHVRMKLLAAVVLVAGLAGVTAWGGEEVFAGDEHMGTCVFEKLTGQDYKFCRGDLEVFYPELGDVGCTYIPKCNQYRKRISKEWRSPKIVYPQADKVKPKSSPLCVVALGQTEESVGFCLGIWIVD
ncbi:hemoglobin subunit pi [Platysternon megacephalum]|uniref:Hemoglobin subunit pi n=1 Tax=Platysternon megacephalum TaxID=55544 RepID=A0A4D9EPW8_9SAUR|nr:hemoglobin subunit pi [Platysternon megacephalum]